MKDDKLSIDQRSSYRGILKATSLFGGVQVYQIIIQVIKSKFIAVLLGPVGVGISGLYDSSTQMIQQITSFGLSQSAVRNVAEASNSGNELEVRRTVSALKKLVWLTGLLGMFVVCILSPILSQTSFGDSLHIWGFVAISVTLLFSQIIAGQKVLLQGMRQYKYLAKCTTIGVTLGLFISVPLYYVWGIDAIVPNIVISSVTALLLSIYYTNKIVINPIDLTYKETFKIGKSMLTMGLTMSLTSFLPVASAFVIRSFIRKFGGIDAVGLYTAGFLLMTQYAGLVFQAMSTDYYTRLAAVNHDNQKCCDIMNQQGEIGLLLISPLMTICVIFIPFVVRILYSDSFLAVNEYIIWCSLGMLFRMAAWSVSFSFIAKAESRLFAIVEGSSGLYCLVIDLLGYYFGGLLGIGIAFLIKYILYTGVVYMIAHKRYQFTYSKDFLKIFLVQTVLVGVSILIVYLCAGVWRYIAGCIVVFLSCCLSYRDLNVRMNFVDFLKSRQK